MTHSDIWYAIDRMAAQLNLTPSALARRSGLDATSFNKSKRYNSDGKPRWPSVQSVAKVLVATHQTIGDFVQYLPADENRASAQA